MNQKLSTALDDMVNAATNEYKTGKKLLPSSWAAKVRAYREAQGYDIYDREVSRFRYTINDLGQLVARIR